MALAGCTAAVEGTGAGEVCTANSTVDCKCLDGSDGFQMCNATGSGFDGQCVCAGSEGEGEGEGEVVDPCAAPPAGSGTGTCTDNALLQNAIDKLKASIVHRAIRLGIGGFDTEIDMVCDESTAADVDGLCYKLDTNGVPTQFVTDCTDGNNNFTSFPQQDQVFDCSDGLNNALMSIVQLANTLTQQDMRSDLAAAVHKGSLNIIFEFEGYKAECPTFTLNVYNGSVAPDNEYNKDNDSWSLCDINDSEANCAFEVDSTPPTSLRATNQS